MEEFEESIIMLKNLVKNIQCLVRVQCLPNDKLCISNGFTCNCTCSTGMKDGLVYFT